MKKIRIPRRPKRLPFKAKFARDARPFGSGERYTSPDLGSIPLLLLCMLGAVILTAAVMLLGKLPKVTAVSAEDGTYYTAAAVLAHVGIEAGDEMLGFDGFAKARELKQSLPLMDKVKIRKHLNGAVTISFTEVESLYYTCHNQNYYIINAETHEVLNVAGDAAEAVHAASAQKMHEHGFGLIVPVTGGEKHMRVQSEHVFGKEPLPGFAGTGFHAGIIHGADQASILHYQGDGKRLAGCTHKGFIGQ